MKKRDPIVSLKIGINQPFSLRKLPPDLQLRVEEFDEQTDENDQTKHVYACYGLAMYYGQVLEQGVQNILSYINGLTHLGALALGRRPIDLARKKTLGRLITIVREHVAIDGDADKLVRVALKKRNFLAHDFFARRIDLMSHPVGLRWMVVELLRSVHLFRMADFVFEPLARTLSSEAGLSEDDIRRIAERTKEDARTRLEAYHSHDDGPLIS